MDEDEGLDMFELEKYGLSDRASLIRFVHLLFYIVKGEVDGGASTSEEQAISQ